MRRNTRTTPKKLRTVVVDRYSSLVDILREVREVRQRQQPSHMVYVFLESATINRLP